jgi:hypothetical protein
MVSLPPDGAIGRPRLSSRYHGVRRAQLVAPKTRDLDRIDIAQQRVGDELERQARRLALGGERVPHRNRMHVDAQPAVRPCEAERIVVRHLALRIDGIARPEEPGREQRVRPDHPDMAEEVRPDLLREADQRRLAAAPAGPAPVDQRRLQIGELRRGHVQPLRLHHRDQVLGLELERPAIIQMGV